MKSWTARSVKTSLIPIDLNAVRKGQPGADVELRPYDVLVIKITPQWEEPGSIELAGEVRFPGKYPIHRGETLSSVLHRAGGFTDLAFDEGAVFIREELKRREKDQLEQLAQRPAKRFGCAVAAGRRQRFCVRLRGQRCCCRKSGLGGRTIIAVAAQGHTARWPIGHQRGSCH